jgi:hypothetical protein
VSSPPQFGHRPCNVLFAQSLQNVHSKVQIIASAESGGRSRSQHSQLGLSCSMFIHSGQLTVMTVAIPRIPERPISGRFPPLRTVRTYQRGHADTPGHTSMVASATQQRPLARLRVVFARFVFA